MEFIKIAILITVLLGLVTAIPFLTPIYMIERLFAELGDAKAQYNLGVSYLRGDGVAKNPNEAVKWFEKAAGQDYAYANYALGIRDEDSLNFFFSKLAIAADNGVAEAQFRIGRGCANRWNNDVEAVKWYRKAADQGLADAQFNLGRCYYNGFGVTQDFTEAVKWYRKAAEQSNVYAQFTLGVCYILGLGAAENYEEAAKWYRKAAEQGFAEAQYGLGLFYILGVGVEKNPAEAVRWYSKAAEQGFAEAQYALGVCYGYGVAKNQDEAVKWYRKVVEQGFPVVQKSSLRYCYALEVPYMLIKGGRIPRADAENGDAEAQFIVGGCYYTGARLKQDFAEALKWYRKAAERGNAAAQFNLGICYAKGQGVAQNFVEAAKWYSLAAEQENSKEKYSKPIVHSNAGAQYCLAICYAGGQGVSQDSGEAVEWFCKAAGDGIVSAQYNLAVCYAGMKGIIRNDAEAIKWYRNAVAGRVKLEHDRIISTLRHRVFVFTEDDTGPAIEKKDFSVLAASCTAALKHWQYLLSIPALLFLLYFLAGRLKRRKEHHNVVR